MFAILKYLTISKYIEYSKNEDSFMRNGSYGIVFSLYNSGITLAMCAHKNT
jgi:hypothetical protein